MKKLLLLFAILLSFIGNAQEHFRLNDTQKNKIKKINTEVLKSVLLVENGLNKNNSKLPNDIFDPYISIISQSYKSQNLSKKQIATLNEIICIKCYEDEWILQQNTKVQAKKVELEKNIANQKPFNKFNRMTLDEASKFAKQIAESAKTEWLYFYEKEDEKHNTYRVVFIRKGLGAEKTEAIKNKTELPEAGDLLVVNFNIRYIGQNKALEIEGTKTYRFYEVRSKYLDLFPIWKKEFNPDADVEKTVDDLRSKEAVDKFAKSKFVLSGSGSSWQIYNWSE